MSTENHFKTIRALVRDAARMATENNELENILLRDLSRAIDALESRVGELQREASEHEERADDAEAELRAMEDRAAAAEWSAEMAENQRAAAARQAERAAYEASEAEANRRFAEDQRDRERRRSF